MAQKIKNSTHCDTPPSLYQAHREEGKHQKKGDSKARKLAFTA